MENEFQPDLSKKTQEVTVSQKVNIHPRLTFYNVDVGQISIFFY